MSLYNLTLESPDTLRVSFGSYPGTNAEITAYVDATIRDMKLPGGKLIKINGPASLPVACVLAHRLCHLFGVVAVFDPKISGYVVAITHDPAFKVGDVIPA
jgi:CRISPR-associated protein Csx3